MTSGTVALDPLCPQQHLPKHNPNRCIFCEYGAAVRTDEREACAAIIDTMLAGDDGDEMSSDAVDWAQDIAQRIRTRGQS